MGYTIWHGPEASFPNGVRLRRLLATGGGAQSTLWRQIVSDITGLRREYVPDADGPVGGAYVAGIALGWFSDFETLHLEVYDRLYPVFCELHACLHPAYAQHSNAMRIPGS